MFFLPTFDQPKVWVWSEYRTFLKQGISKKVKGEKILAGFSLGENDLNFWNPMFFNNNWSAHSMKLGQDTKLSQEEEFRKKCKGKKILAEFL
jgi:hypothetical protein